MGKAKNSKRVDRVFQKDVNYNDRYGGAIFINRESGVEPQIADGVTINGLVDCIHLIKIGRDTFTGHSVAFLTGGHNIRLFREERKKSLTGGEIIIGEGVWIASFAIILGPSTIGNHAVIGAGAVLRGDVPEYGMVIGNPAKVIKIIPH